jgi:hypothetical protein
VVKVIIYMKMLFIFSTPVLIEHLWQLKTVVFLHWCLICAVLLYTCAIGKFKLTGHNWAEFSALGVLVQGILSGANVIKSFILHKVVKASCVCPFQKFANASVLEVG